MHLSKQSVSPVSHLRESGGHPGYVVLAVSNSVSPFFPPTMPQSSGAVLGSLNQDLFFFFFAITL
jgi:hypothetical protein